jgi:hypothetical protein
LLVAEIIPPGRLSWVGGPMGSFRYSSLLQKATKRKPPSVFHRGGLGILYSKPAGRSLNFSPKWMDKVLPELVQLTDFSRLWTFRTIFDSELHALALLQVPESVTDNGGVMNENVLRTAIGLDESVPLHAAEPLDRTLRLVCHLLMHLPFATML